MLRYKNLLKNLQNRLPLNLPLRREGTGWYQYLPSFLGTQCQWQLPPEMLEQKLKMEKPELLAECQSCVLRLFHPTLNMISITKIYTHYTASIKEKVKVTINFAKSSIKFLSMGRKTHRRKANQVHSFPWKSIKDQTRDDFKPNLRRAMSWILWVMLCSGCTISWATGTTLQM